MAEQLTRQDKLEFLEYAGSIVWFLLDGMWMLGWQMLATGMAFPAAILNFAIFLYTPRTFFQMAVTIAMNAWLCMNICWMLSDFFKHPELVLWAKAFMVIGVAALMAAVLRGLRDPNALKVALARFRRFRLSSVFR